MTINLTLADITPEQHQAIYEAAPDVVPAPTPAEPSHEWECVGYPQLRTAPANAAQFVGRLYLGEDSMLMEPSEAQQLIDQLTWMLDQRTAPPQAPEAVV